MKHYILFLFSCIAFMGYAQKIDDVFKTMPDELLPAFSEANKTMLLVDTSLSVIPYALGEIEKLAYSETFLSIRTSDVGTMQIKLLPLMNNTQIIALIKTVCGQVCDSNIRFYTNDWEKIDKTNVLPSISPDVFFDSSKLNSQEFKWATSHIDIYPLQFEFTKGSDNLGVKLDFEGYLSKEDLKKTEPYVNKKTITLSWNKSMFVY